MKKVILISFILFLCLFNNNDIGAKDTNYGYEPPPRNFPLLIKYPSTCSIYIGSDGKFYSELEGYNVCSFGESTPEKAFKEAQKWVEWKKKEDSKAYTLLFIKEL